ncbi:hypothetical protein SAMN05444392_101704 [Seinonella peptonophila]|uniref:Uncharacterized protein n=1 Tax=Seinonella peptonophila TaxID=112248 RepID=A0A1M4TY74_9BACL|nr:hypothetical protein [Seinonella peptonophila]SHE49356.1 hypothetical protein SAMN05444392_101704 [Seinonella peptonophila]
MESYQLSKNERMIIANTITMKQQSSSDFARAERIWNDFAKTFSLFPMNETNPFPVLFDLEKEVRQQSEQIDENLISPHKTMRQFKIVVSLSQILVQVNRLRNETAVTGSTPERLAQTIQFILESMSRIMPLKTSLEASQLTDEEFGLMQKVAAGSHELSKNELESYVGAIVKVGKLLNRPDLSVNEIKLLSQLIFPSNSKLLESMQPSVRAQPIAALIYVQQMLTKKYAQDSNLSPDESTQVQTLLVENSGYIYKVTSQRYNQYLKKREWQKEFGDSLIINRQGLDWVAKVLSNKNAREDAQKGLEAIDLLTKWTTKMVGLSKKSPVSKEMIALWKRNLEYIEIKTNKLMTRKRRTPLMFEGNSIHNRLAVASGMSQLGYKLGLLNYRNALRPPEGQFPVDRSLSFLYNSLARIFPIRPTNSRYIERGELNVIKRAIQHPLSLNSKDIQRLPQLIGGISDMIETSDYLRKNMLGIHNSFNRMNPSDMVEALTQFRLEEQVNIISECINLQKVILTNTDRTLTDNNGFKYQKIFLNNGRLISELTRCAYKQITQQPELRNRETDIRER